MGQARDLVERGYELWNRGGEGLIDLVHVNAHGVYTDAGELLGGEALVSHWQSYRAAFPDGKVTVDRITEAGNIVVAETTFTGTNTGPMQTPMGELAPTNQQVVGAGCEIFEIRDGKVFEVRGYLDTGAMMIQLGLVGQPIATQAN